MTVKPENKTIVNCLKILIRMARTNKTIAGKIFENDLMQNIFTNLLFKFTDTVTTNHPYHFALKLVRIVASYGSSMCTKLQALGINEILKSYMFIRSDITVSFFFFFKYEIQFRFGRNFKPKKNNNIFICIFSDKFDKITN